jgi:hypothetical protein
MTNLIYAVRLAWIEKEHREYKSKIETAEALREFRLNCEVEI